MKKILEAILAINLAVLSCIVFPDIDGITLARQLAQQYPSLVLIGFSAHVIDETLRQRTSSLFR
ncbi:hypothetical protein F1394_23375, partial [Escherichia coli]|nr:hypothetical protein [Escherichia coli]